MTTMDVEVDILSGMPNPRWTLSDTQAKELLTKLSELSESQPKPRAADLGYRGFIVRIQQGAYREIYVHNDYVEINGPTMSSSRSDPGRSLERWLLATGRRHLSKELLSAIERDLEDS